MTLQELSTRRRIPRLRFRRGIRRIQVLCTCLYQRKPKRKPNPKEPKESLRTPKSSAPRNNSDLDSSREPRRRMWFTTMSSTRHISRRCSSLDNALKSSCRPKPWRGPPAVRILARCAMGQWTWVSGIGPTLICWFSRHYNFGQPPYSTTPEQSQSPDPEPNWIVWGRFRGML